MDANVPVLAAVSVLIKYGFVNETRTWREVEGLQRQSLRRASRDRTGDTASIDFPSALDDRRIEFPGKTGPAPGSVNIYFLRSEFELTTEAVLAEARSRNLRPIWPQALYDCARVFPDRDVLLASLAQNEMGTFVTLFLSEDGELGYMVDRCEHWPAGTIFPMVRKG